MMKVLFIDEDAAAVKDGIERLEELGHDCHRIDFNDLDDALPSYQPHIVVLDMMNGGTKGDSRGDGGKISFDKIWDTGFCPIVVYSANPDLIDDIESGNADHPLVKKIKKGKDSDEKLQKQIIELEPCIDGMKGIIEDVNKVLQTTLRDVTPHIFSQDGIDEVETAIQYMGRRRVSALMDDSSMLRLKLAPEEQHIFPPLGDHPKTGDILLSSSDKVMVPESYRVVLTPSCDLVKVDGRPPKVTNILCARCENSDVLFSKAQISKKNNEQLIKVLNDGYIREYLPIPGFKGVIPPMVANLKNLELITYDSVGNKLGDNISFIRVTSIDSPFREQIVWAYQNSGCRPGVPDRDSDSWAKQYIDNADDKGEKK